MEVPVIVEALRATTNAGSQQEAVQYLENASKAIGFLPLLAQIAIDDRLDLTVRQGAVIFFKNGVSRGWIVSGDEAQKDVVSTIATQDKNAIKAHLLEYIVRAPTPIRIQFCTAVQNILRYDFPDNWPTFAPSLFQILSVDDANNWAAGLAIIFRLAKIFEFKRKEEKSPIVGLMKELLPILCGKLAVLVKINTEDASVLEHLILKIYSTLTKFSLNTSMITVVDFGHWLELLAQIIERPIPDVVKAREEPDELYLSSVWRAKKWAMKILSKSFDRYGAQGQVEKMYQEYADFYFQHFADRITHDVLKVLHDKTNGEYVSSRYLYFALTLLSDSLAHASVWRIVKPHFADIVYHVLYPLMGFDEEDEDLWDTEMLEFIQLRHDDFNEMHSPVVAATLVLNAGVRRKGFLNAFLQHFVQILQNPASTPKDIAGSLHVLGCLLERLAGSSKFKRSVEKIVEAYVLPWATHENRFVRLYTFFCLANSMDVSYKTPAVQQKLVDCIVGRLVCPNEQLPVKVEAAVALHMLIDKKGIRNLVRPRFREVITEIFRILAQATIDEMTNVADSLIEIYPNDCIPVAVDIAKEIYNLIRNLANVDEDDDGNCGDVTVILYSLLGTMQTLLELVDEHPEITSQLEPVVFDIVTIIYGSDATDYFEEAISLVQSLLVVHISDKAWDFLPAIRRCFDMAPVDDPKFPTMSTYIGCLHSYITIDTDKFLSIPERTIWVLEMCEATLKNPHLDNGDHICAAKVLEIFILQCKGRVDQCIPHILQIVMNRLQHGNFDDDDLVPQLLVVIIAAIYYDFDLFVQILPSLEPYGMGTVQWIFSEILRNQEHIQGIHNRKMVIYAVCCMLRLPVEHQPPAISQTPQETMNLLLNMFEGIEKCVKAMQERKKAEEEDDESDDESDDDDHRAVDDELRDSEDDADESTLEYIEELSRLEKKIDRKRGGEGDADAPDNFSTDDDDSEGFDMFVDETEMESYTTPIDNENDGLNVYVDFKQCIEHVQATTPAQFALLTSLGEDKATDLKKLFEYCVQQENFVNSRNIARAGGCDFNASMEVPKSFDFSK